MSSNTQILIRRSLSTSAPSSLLQGELAYSYSSNTLFIGSPAGTGAIAIGGWSDLTNLTPGTYGDATNIPIITVDDLGRITNVATSPISTTISLDADIGSNTMSLLTGTLTFTGGDGITTTIGNNTSDVQFDVDNTVIRTLASVGPQTIDTDLTITGNVNITGNVTSHGSEDLIINDPIILLANNNTADVVDIGFVAHYVESGNTLHTGLVRHAATDTYYLFKDYLPHILEDNNILNIADPTLVVSGLAANLISKSSQIDALQVANVTSSTGTVTIDDDLIVLGTSTLQQVNATSLGVSGDSYLGGGLTVLGNTNLPGGVTFTTIGTFTANDIIANTVTTSFDITSGQKVLAAQSSGTVGGGFSFTGTEGGRDSGMFSPSDGEVHFYSDDVDVAEFTQSNFTIKTPTYLTGINQGATLNVVYWNASTGELTYDVDNSLTPTSIANLAFSLSISGTNGLLSTNGAGLQLANGAIIKDTSGDAVAFGQNAGTIAQGAQAVAIGDSAGYNSQSAYGVAIGYGAGNVNQGTTAVAIGLNAGVTNQGAYGIAIGNSSGPSQGQYSIALGYDSGNSQSDYSIAIGNQAAKGNTSAIGTNSIAIGNKAGYESAAASSIILNASGSNFSSTTSGFFVNPVRYTATQDSTNDGIVFYNQSTKEFRYSYKLDGGSF